MFLFSIPTISSSTTVTANEFYSRNNQVMWIKIGKRHPKMSGMGLNWATYKKVRGRPFRRPLCFSSCVFYLTVRLFKKNSFYFYLDTTIKALRLFAWCSVSLQGTPLLQRLISCVSPYPRPVKRCGSMP